MDTKRRYSLLLVATAVVTLASSSDSPIPQTSLNSPPLEFASPLQSFTIFDKATLESARANSPRAKFLPRFRVGLAAEQKIREKILEEKKLADLGQEDEDAAGLGGSGGGGGGANWAEMSAAADEAQRKKEEQRIERAYDRATALYNEKTKALSADSSTTSPTQAAESGACKYQFVGVVNPSSSKQGEKAVTWYARKKPKGSKWSVRMVRVDRDAIARDLHVRGKIDVYGQYVNKGVPVEQRKLAKERGLGVDERPVLEGKYTVRERSWRTLWNFNPKRFFSDSSGMFWRERRLSPGLYTDGRVVYESVYRYRDGKNGMKPVSLLSQFLDSKAVEEDVKEKVMVRLKVDSPDVVIED